MKLFVITILIGFTIVGGLFLDTQAQLHPDYPFNIDRNTDSGYLANSSDFSDFLHFALNKESNAVVIQHEFPTVSKYSNSDLFTEKKYEQAKNSRISGYLSFADCKISRFEGADIIHPFNYFW